MRAATQTKLDPERQARREAEKRYVARHRKFQRQAASAIIVCKHQFGVLDHDADPRMVCASYDDVIEYGRMVLGDEDVVLLDSWGNVIEDAEGKSYFHDKPQHMALGKYAKQGERHRYVEHHHRAYDVRTIRVVSFRDDLKIPKCGPCKQTGDGHYVTGPKGDRERFMIARRKGYRRSNVIWSCTDTKTGTKDEYHSRMKDALAQANRILRVEACRAQIAEGFKDPNPYM